MVGFWDMTGGRYYEEEDLRVSGCGNEGCEQEAKCVTVLYRYTASGLGLERGLVSANDNRRANNVNAYA